VSSFIVILTFFGLTFNITFSVNMQLRLI
jgi:hypothetical protein